MELWYAQQYVEHYHFLQKLQRFISKTMLEMYASNSRLSRISAIKGANKVT